jgi:glucosyl-dolichyl phosphate glucuronosyltransferase
MITIDSAQFTVAICTLNRHPYLERAVDAVLGQLAQFPDRELLIVDNGSTDGTREYLRELQSRHSNCRSVCEQRRGLYYARARAIEEASGQYLIFLDDDVVPQNGWLRAMLEELTSAANVGAVGSGTVEPIWEGLRPQWLDHRLMREIPVMRLDGRQTARFPCYPPGLSLGIRLNECASIYIAPPRRTDYLLGRKSSDHADTTTSLIGGEDTDLCEIYARSGYEVVISDKVRVAHTVNKERLTQEFYLRRFESEGRLRVRMVRIAGYSLLGKHTFKILLGAPIFAIGNLTAGAFRDPARLLLRAYYVKCVGAWRELLFGPRVNPLPYNVVSDK